MSKQPCLVDVIDTALSLGSEIAREFWGTVQGRVKDGDPNQVVTEADLAVGTQVMGFLQKQFPHDSFLDEELGFQSGSSDRTWVIDPIDGTSNFATGVPLFGVMIGVLSHGDIVAGGVVLPILEETYLAERGAGAWLNDERIHVSQETDLQNVLIAWGIDSNRDQPDSTRNEIRVVGEVALRARNLRSSNSVFDQMMVARGGYGGCFNFSSRIWDNVAPQIIITEAGGHYTDLTGAALNYSKAEERMPDCYRWCAAAPGLHQSLLTIIQG